MSVIVSSSMPRSAHDAEVEALSFSTSAVAAATGLPVSTILAWERRYGLPRPRRTAGGRRLYSADDLRLVQAMEAKIADGTRAAVAARELQSLDGQLLTNPRRGQRCVPTAVEELACLHCGTSGGELHAQMGPAGRHVRLVAVPGSTPPRRGAGGRPRCGRCGGSLYTEPREQRLLPPFPSSLPGYEDCGAA